MTGSARSEQRIASERAPAFLSHERPERLSERVFCHVAYLVRLEPEGRHVPVRGLEDGEERRSSHPGRARDCDGGRCIGLGRPAAAWLMAGKLSLPRRAFVSRRQHSGVWYLRSRPVMGMPHPCTRALEIEIGG
jgi:hypothetical protein